MQTSGWCYASLHHLHPIYMHLCNHITHRNQVSRVIGEQFTYLWNLVTGNQLVWVIWFLSLFKDINLDLTARERQTHQTPFHSATCVNKPWNVLYTYLNVCQAPTHCAGFTFSTILVPDVKTRQNCFAWWSPLSSTHSSLLKVADWQMSAGFVMLMYTCEKQLETWIQRNQLPWKI